MPTAAGMPPGSGANFKALEGKLAARGAHNPGALAAWIGRKKYGKKGMAALSGKGRHAGGGGHKHANDGGDMRQIHLAGTQMQCPNCGYRSDDADFSVSGGASGTDSPSQPEDLRTPQSKLPTGSGTLPLTVRGAGSPDMGLANRSGRAVNLARRFPVQSQMDMVVTRSADGSHLVRHRQGGTEVGKLRKTEDGRWQPVVDGKELEPANHQRTALMSLIGSYNRTTVTADRTGTPLQPPPAQTPLMAAYGVPAIRLASSDDSDDDGDNDDTVSGDTDDDFIGSLNPKGQAIYKKLRSKGMAQKVALAMAKRAQNAKPGVFSTSSSKAS